MGFALRVAWPEPVTWTPGSPRVPAVRGGPGWTPRGVGSTSPGVFPAGRGGWRPPRASALGATCTLSPFYRRSRWPEPWSESALERAAGTFPELGLRAVPAVAGGDATTAGLLARWVPGRAPETVLAFGAIPEPLSPCLAGGDVTFDISNDAPTMAGAEATFSIALRFPSTQAVLPDGRVVWSQNCTVNGQRPPKPPPPAPRPSTPCHPLILCSLQAPASPRVSPSSRSSWPRARIVSSPMGSRSPPAPGASVENSSTSGGRGVRPAPTPAGVRGVSEAVSDLPPVPQGATGRWWMVPRPN